MAFVIGLGLGFFGWRVSRNDAIEPPVAGDVEEMVEFAGRSRGNEAKSDRQSPDPLSRLGMLERIAAASRDELPELSREIFAEASNRYPLLFSLLDRWVEVDAEAGFLFFSGFDGDGIAESSLDAAVYEYCGRWARVDPEAALEAARGLDEPRIRDTAMSRVAQALALARPTDFFRILEGGHSEGFTFYIPRAARALAAVDPSGAAAVLEAMDAETRKKKRVAADVASGWAKHDPERALSWARELEDDRERLDAMQAVAGRLLERDPDRAAQIFKECLAEKQPESTGLEFRLVNYNWQSAVKLLSETDSAAAIAWMAEHFPESAGPYVAKYLPLDAPAAVEILARLPAAVLKEQKLPGWPTDRWRPVDVEAAIGQLDSIHDPVTRESAHAWLLGALALDDPGAAIMGSSEFADPANRAHVLKLGMTKWARVDLTAASEWLAARPAGTETDGAIVSLVEVAKYLEPDSALSWAAAVTEPKKRVQQIATAYNAWRARDEEAARIALAAIPLSDAEVSKLRERGIDIQK